MVIKANENNIRIDKYLATLEGLSYSREFINKMIDNNAILVNGKNIKSSYKIKENDEITIDESFKQEINIEPVEMPLNIVFEDENVLVIDKPSGLVVHPGSGNYNNTLVNGLMYYTKNLSNVGGEERPGIVHRIDKDTSGLMLVAKTNEAHKILAEDFKNKRVKREYIALVCGVLPHNSATIDAPIGRDKVNRQRMAVTSDNSKNAVTHLTVLKRYKDYTLVKLQLETGRTHQIRVHLSYIGYPIYNDPVYLNKNATEFGQFLHSASIDFIEPITKEHLHFESALPKEFQEFLDNLETI